MGETDLTSAVNKFILRPPACFSNEQEPCPPSECDDNPIIIFVSLYQYAPLRRFGLLICEKETFPKSK